MSRFEKKRKWQKSHRVISGFKIKAEGSREQP